MMVLFRAVLRLHGEPPTGDNTKTAARVGELAGFDPAPFHAGRATRTRRGEALVRSGGPGAQRIPGGDRAPQSLPRPVWCDMMSGMPSAPSARSEHGRVNSPSAFSGTTPMKRRWLALLLPLALGACGYNTIQQLDEQANSAQGQIEVQLQRRAELIPNLVATVKGIANQELAAFGEVARPRGPDNAVQSRGPRADGSRRTPQASGALARLIAVAEAYPQLKSDQSFLRLQDELAERRTALRPHRRITNGAVQQYNAYIRQFPAALTAKLTGAKRRSIFRRQRRDPREPERRFRHAGLSGDRAPGRSISRPPPPPPAPAKAVGAGSPNGKPAATRPASLLERATRLCARAIQSRRAPAARRSAASATASGCAELRPELLRLFRHEGGD